MFKLGFRCVIWPRPYNIANHVKLWSISSLCSQSSLSLILTPCEITPLERGTEIVFFNMFINTRVRRGAGTYMVAAPPMDSDVYACSGKCVIIARWLRAIFTAFLLAYIYIYIYTYIYRYVYIDVINPNWQMYLQEISHWNHNLFLKYG